LTWLKEIKQMSTEHISATPVRSKDHFLVFGAPRIENPEIEEVIESLRAGWIGTGPKVARFEGEFAAYRNAGHAVAVNSCTAALHLSMLVAGLQPGDEVITTPMTFCATVNAILHAHLEPVLADIDPVTMNLDPRQVQQRITPRTRALLVVHFAGRPCPMDELMDIAKKNNLIVIEDCAHAIEAEFDGQPVGTFGQFGCFSFYVTKNLTTGEGGMILTDSSDRASKLKTLALHGMSRDAWKRFSDEGYKHYEVVDLGFKYNMMDIQAALGLHQLASVEEYLKRREHVWEMYNEALRDFPATLPADPAPNSRHARHLYTILISEEDCGMTRDKCLESMTKHNIGAGVHYRSIPEHGYYQQRLGCRVEDYPNAMSIGRQTISLPLSAKLTDRDVEDVVEALRRTLRLG